VHRVIPAGRKNLKNQNRPVCNRSTGVPASKNLIAGYHVELIPQKLFYCEILYSSYEWSNVRYSQSFNQRWML